MLLNTLKNKKLKKKNLGQVLLGFIEQVFQYQP